MIKKMTRSTVSTLFYLFSPFFNRQGIVVLMYHRVNDTLPPGELVISSAAFRRQMAFLRDNGYKVINANEFAFFLHKNKEQGFAKPQVLITFDDGYRDNYLNAYPILKEFAFPAVIFLSTDFMGTDRRFKRYSDLDAPDMMSWEEAQKMSGTGIFFAPHTMNHPHLSSLSMEQQEEEIKGSIKAVRKSIYPEDKIGFFCYPYGDYNQATLEILHREGIDFAFTVKPGINNGKEHPLELRRILISGIDTLFDFRKKLCGAYDLPYTVTQLLK